MIWRRPSSPPKRSTRRSPDAKAGSSGPELTAAVGPASPGTLIPDNDATGVGASLTVTNSGIGHVEVVEVEVTIAHTRSGDLELTLSRSGGVSDVLHPQHGCLDPDTGQQKCSNIDAFVFTSMRHLDEPADGTWTLTVKDRRTGTVGTFTSWKLRVFGRQ